MKATELQKAYFAGFFDGEGTFRCPSKRIDKGGYWDHGIAIYQQDRKPLEQIHKIYGGHFAKSNNCWELAMSNAQAGLFILDIFPYLIVKRDKAMKFIEFRKTFSGRKYTRFNPVPIGVRQKRLDLIALISPKNKFSFSFS